MGDHLLVAEEEARCDSDEEKSEEKDADIVSGETTAIAESSILALDELAEESSVVCGSENVRSSLPSTVEPFFGHRRRAFMIDAKKNKQKSDS